MVRVGFNKGVNICKKGFEDERLQWKVALLKYLDGGPMA